MAPLSTLLYALVAFGAVAGSSVAPELPRTAGSQAARRPGGQAEPTRAAPAAIAHYLRAQVALVRGDERSAVQEIELAIAFDSASAGLRAAAADLFLSVGNVSRASAEARRAVDLGRKSDLDALLRGHAVLGRIAASESRWTSAAADLGAAARIADTSPAGEGASPPAFSAEDRFVLGVALETLRRWDDAASTFGRVGSGDALGPLAALRQAHSLSRGRRHAEALEVIARSRRPGDTRFATMQAFVLGRAGRSDEAAAGLRAEIASQSEHEPAGSRVGELVEALGAALVEAGRPGDAVTELERGLSLRPRDRKLLLGLAAALGEAGDVEGAASHARQLLEEDPDDVEALNFVGYLLADHGIRLDEAERLLLRAAELAPREGAVLDSLGWLWFRKGDTARAIRTLERAESLAPPDATILDHLGDAYRAGRRNGDAAQAWRRALAELDADPPAAAGEAAKARRQRAEISRKLESLTPARAVR